MNAFSNAVDTCLRELRKVAGVSVTYVRGGVRVEVDAIPSEVFDEPVTDDYSVARPIDTVNEYAFRVSVDDLRTLGEPQDGDKIFQTIPGRSLRYTVAPLESGQDPFVYVGTGRKWYRVRCVLDGETVHA